MERRPSLSKSSSPRNSNEVINPLARPSSQERDAGEHTSSNNEPRRKSSDVVRELATPLQEHTTDVSDATMENDPIRYREQLYQELARVEEFLAKASQTPKEDSLSRSRQLEDPLITRFAAIQDQPGSSQPHGSPIEMTSRRGNEGVFERHDSHDRTSIQITPEEEQRLQVNVDNVLDKLNIHPGDDEYTGAMETAREMFLDLKKIQEGEGRVAEQSEALTKSDRSGTLNKMFISSKVKIDLAVNAWKADRTIEELNSTPPPSKFGSSKLGKGWVEGEKTIIKVNKRLEPLVKNRPGQVLFALSLAAVGTAFPAIIAGRFLPSTFVSNTFSSVIGNKLFEKAPFPINAIADNVQWLGVSVGAYLAEKAGEKKEANITHANDGHANFTNSAFANQLTESYANLTIGNTTLHEFITNTLNGVTDKGPVFLEQTNTSNISNSWPDTSLNSRSNELNYHAPVTTGLGWTHLTLGKP